jgi:hypothetical protein
MRLLNTAKPGIRLTPLMLTLHFGQTGSTIGWSWVDSF